MAIFSLKSIGLAGAGTLGVAGTYFASKGLRGNKDISTSLSESWGENIQFVDPSQIDGDETEFYKKIRESGKRIIFTSKPPTGRILRIPKKDEGGTGVDWRVINESLTINGHVFVQENELDHKTNEEITKIFKDQLSYSIKNNEIDRGNISGEAYAALEEFCTINGNKDILNVKKYCLEYHIDED